MSSVEHNKGKGNPYHDASGKFCSEGQMIGEIQAALRSGAVNVYFNLRADYEAIKRHNVPEISPDAISNLISGELKLNPEDEDNVADETLNEQIGSERFLPATPTV